MTVKHGFTDMKQERKSLKKFSSEIEREHKVIDLMDFNRIR